MVLIEDTDKNQDHAFLERIVACFAERSRCLFLRKTPCTYARYRCGGRTPSINSQTSVELISGLELGSVENEAASKEKRSIERPAGGRQLACLNCLYHTPFLQSTSEKSTK